VGSVNRCPLMCTPGVNSTGLIVGPKRQLKAIVKPKRAGCAAAFLLFWVLTLVSAFNGGTVVVLVFALCQVSCIPPPNIASAHAVRPQREADHTTVSSGRCILVLFTVVHSLWAQRCPEAGVFRHEVAPTVCVIVFVCYCVWFLDETGTRKQSLIAVNGQLTTPAARPKASTGRPAYTILLAGG
jgi:hypothetical protein